MDQVNPRSPVPREAAGASLGLRAILRFFTPLALTSLLVTLSGPMLNVALARSLDPTLHLAAFWIGFAIVMFLESACLVMQPITVALAAERGAPRRLAAASLAAGLAAAALVLAVATTPLGALVFRHAIPTTPRAAELARVVLLQLAPIPVLVAVRGVASGLAIAAHRTAWVAAATALRLGVLSAVVVAAVASGASGARVAAWAVLAGTLAETALIVGLTLPRARSAQEPRAGAGTRVGLAGIARLAAPLTLGLLIWASLRPAIHAILGRLPDPELAQASFGVVLPVLMVSCAPLWTLQDVSLVLPRGPADLRRVLGFALAAATASALAIAAVLGTPLGASVLRLGFDLSPRLERAVAPALILVALEPLALAARAVAQGLLVRARRTGVLLAVSPVKIALTLIVGLWLAAHLPRIDAATLALGLILGGDLLEASILGLRVRQLLARGAWTGAAEPAAPLLGVPPAMDPDPPASLAEDARAPRAA
jgi:hypothetical protein